MLLSVSSTNPRYLVNELAEPVCLCGFHTWYNVQDGGGSDPPAAFDWDGFADALESYGCNFTKLWASLETAQLWADPLSSGFNPQYFAPSRYDRPGPGTANDGKSKFDLSSIEQDFIARLVDRVADLRNRGIYACIQLFQGWQIDTKGGSDNPATYHPYLAANNINSLDGDYNDDGALTETHTDSNNAAWSYQQDLVEAIIDAVNLYDNVFYEISNEDTGSPENTNWQEAMIDHITTYEATKPKQHLIMRTVCYPNGSNTDLDASAAPLVCYNGDKADDVLDGTKVAFRDSDHVEGIATDYDWVWPALCNGSGGVWYMDEWDGALYGTDRRASAGYMAIRSNLGYVNTLFNMLNNPLLMTPQPSLSTSGYCLARDHATAGEYVCYYDGSSTFNLNLSTATGTLNIRWLRCSDGTVQDGATVSGGAVRTLTPPWTGRVVAYVRHT